MRNYSSNKRNNTKPNSGGIGFLGLLTILFIGLKLTGYIDWSWWQVLAPIWLSIPVILTLIIITWVFLVLKDLISKRK